LLTLHSCPHSIFLFTPYALMLLLLQSIVNNASLLQDWTPSFRTSEVRQTENMDSSDYESLHMETIAAAQYVNLLIAAQCDYFVGTLASNWDRVINELRLTNGRLRFPYMSLKNDEW